jgi:cytidylate kinase
VICPTAEAKLYVTASADVRAKRRFDELLAKGMDVTLVDVLADVQARDTRDRERVEAPLVAAVDAVVIDTSDLSIDAAVAAAIAAIEEVRA